MCRDERKYAWRCSWRQLSYKGIGMLTVWGSVPIEKASMHQLGAMTLLTTGILALGACRRVDPRHLKNMLYKLKMEDPKNYKILMKNAEADTKQPLKELQKYRRKKAY